jgi:hypothetical protein
MEFDSDDLRFALPLDSRERSPARSVVVEDPRPDRVRRRDDAEQRLAERVAPGAHRAEVAPARREAAHRMRVHEPDDVPARLLTA